MIVYVFMENRKTSTGSDTIYYDFNRSLKWSDFKGKSDQNYFAGAVTASGFAFDSQMDFDGTNISLNIGVYTFFAKNDSWKKPQINSDYHLLHEQHHFDITRIGSEEFINELKKAHFTRDNYTTLLTSIFNKVYKKIQTYSIYMIKKPIIALMLKSNWNGMIKLLPKFKS